MNTQWCKGLLADLECIRPWVSALVKTVKLVHIFAVSPLSMGHFGVLVVSESESVCGLLIW